jgi:soluble lytic murein transglycosylase-like protein
VGNFLAAILLQADHDHVVECGDCTGHDSAFMMRSGVLLLFLAALATPCVADGLYGYVDQNGVAHWSNLALEGYILFRKDPPSAADSTAADTQPNRAAAADARLPAAALRRRYSELVARVAREQQIDVALLHAIVTVESGYNERARSPKGASGLMQLMPGTAQRYGVMDVWNPLENLRGGARYLRDLLVLFKDNLNLALAAYNAGEGAVIGSGYQIPPYPETRSYVPRVLQHYQQYRSGTKL